LARIHSCCSTRSSVSRCSRSFTSSCGR
jgi:hypothetical protein